MAADDKLPNLDVQKYCRSRANAAAGLDVAATSFRGCVESEQKAKNALTAAWKDIPPFYRSTCIKPNDYSPSYEEWIACMEMYMDVKSMRSKK